MRLQWLAAHKAEESWEDEGTRARFAEEELRLRDVLAKLEEGGHVHFDLEKFRDAHGNGNDGRKSSDVCVTLQGNPEFYTDEQLFKRNRLLHSTLVRSTTWLFWHLVSGANADFDPDHLEFEPCVTTLW